MSKWTHSLSSSEHKTSLAPDSILFSAHCSGFIMLCELCDDFAHIYILFCEWVLFSCTTLTCGHLGSPSKLAIKSMISDFVILPSLSRSKSLKASMTSESILVESFLELFRTATGLAVPAPDITGGGAALNCLLLLLLVATLSSFDAVIFWLFPFNLTY